MISIFNGTFESEEDETNPYVKIYLDQKYLMKTRTLENNRYPVFNQAFVTPIITSDTQISFVAFSRGDSTDKLLLTVQTTVDFVLAMGLNGVATCQPEGSPRGSVCFSIRWTRELG